MTIIATKLLGMPAEAGIPPARSNVHSFLASIQAGFPTARDEAHFGTNAIERAAVQIEDTLKGDVDGLHLPERLESQQWVKLGEQLGQNAKAQLEGLFHDTGARIDWKDLQSVTSSLSSFREGQRQTWDRMLSSLSPTAGKFLPPPSAIMPVRSCNKAARL